MDNFPAIITIKIPWWKMLFHKKSIRIPFKKHLDGPAVFDDAPQMTVYENIESQDDGLLRRMKGLVGNKSETTLFQRKEVVGGVPE